MRREQRDPSSYSHSTIKPVSEGGTGTSVLANFITALDVVVDDPTDPNGPVIINSDGTIPIDVIPLSITPIPSVVGPKSLFASQSGTFTITNYDSDAAYSLSALAGSVSRNNDTITYVAPSTTGISGFSLDGRLINVDVVATGVSTPSIVSPVNNTNNLGSSVTFTGNAFAVISQSDTHVMSDWELATDNGFLNVVKSEYSSVANKTTWSVSGLTPNTTYYARVRYKGNSLGYSAWSPSIKVSTKSSFYPTSPMATIPLSSFIGKASDLYSDVLISSSYDGNTFCFLTKETRGGIERAVIYVYRKINNIWTQVADLFFTNTSVLNRESIEMSNDGKTILFVTNADYVNSVYLIKDYITSWNATPILANLNNNSDEQTAISKDLKTIYYHNEFYTVNPTSGSIQKMTVSGLGNIQNSINISLSEDGSTVVHENKIYNLNNNTLTLSHTLISNDSVFNSGGFDRGVISNDGNVVVLLSYDNNTGISRICPFFKNTQLGTWIEGPILQGSGIVNSSFGFQISLSANGSLLAVTESQYRHSDNVSVGKTYLYKRNNNAYEVLMTLSPNHFDGIVSGNSENFYVFKQSNGSKFLDIYS